MRTNFGPNIFFEFDMRDEDDLCPNFYLGYKIEPIFSRPILRLRNYSHLLSPYLSSGQIDSISILLRSAGGRALSCRTKLIVSLRWNHSARSTAKVRNAIDSSHRWLAEIDRFFHVDELMTGACRRCRQHDINRQNAFFQNLRNWWKEDCISIRNIPCSTKYY